MFVAMNRFKVEKGSGGRKTHLEGVPGLIEFYLLKGPEADGHGLYASHSMWRSEANFCLRGTTLTTTGANALLVSKRQPAERHKARPGGHQGINRRPRRRTDRCPRAQLQGTAERRPGAALSIAIVIVDHAAIGKRQVRQEMMSDDDLLYGETGNRRIDVRHEMKPARSDP
jgi:hypothetical protein